MVAELGESPSSGRDRDRDRTRTRGTLRVPALLAPVVSSFLSQVTLALGVDVVMIW